MKYLKKYAKGGIITKEKNNPLNAIAEAVGEDTLIAAKEGESVLTPEQTEAMTELAEKADSSPKWKDPDILTVEEYAKTLGVDYNELIRQASMGPEHMESYYNARVPEIASERTNNNKNTVNVHYDSLITVNGDVNDTKHFLNDMKNVAKDAIEKSWHEFDLTRKYGTY